MMLPIVANLISDFSNVSDHILEQACTWFNVKGLKIILIVVLTTIFNAHNNVECVARLKS